MWEDLRVDQRNSVRIRGLWLGLVGCVKILRVRLTVRVGRRVRLLCFPHNSPHEHEQQPHNRPSSSTYACQIIAGVMGC